MSCKMLTCTASLFRPIAKILPIKVATKTGSVALKQHDQIGIKRQAISDPEPSSGKRRDDGDEGRKGGGNDEGLAGLLGYSDSEDGSDSDEGAKAGPRPQLTSEEHITDDGLKRPSKLPPPDELLSGPCIKSKDLDVKGE